MNGWQVLKQLRYRLRQRTWAGTGSVVFNSRSVLISVGPEEQALETLIAPMAILRPGGASSDPVFDEEPDLLVETVYARLIAVVAGDHVGENALLGANRSGGVTKSEGRGLMELEEELFASIKVMNLDDGIRIQSRAKGAAEANFIEPVGYIVWRDYEFEVICTADRFYETPVNLVATNLGGGQASLTWTLPPDRYDRSKVLLRRAVGATPPATATSGTGVTLSGDLATSVTDSPGAGTFSYSLFAEYNEGADFPLRYSSAVSRASVVVT